MRPSDLPPGVHSSNPMIVGEEVVDALDEIFTTQEGLQRSIFQTNPADLPIRDKVTFVTTMILGAMDELGEMLREVRGWKPHRPHEEPAFSDDKLAGEARDLLQFAVNIMLACGWTSEDLEDAYYRKVVTNYERLRSAAPRCGRCGESLDDGPVSCQIVACPHTDG